MPNFAVSTGFSATDRGVTTFFKKAGAAANKFGNQSKGAFDKASKASGGFTNRVSALVSGNLITSGLNLLRVGVGAVVREFISFDQSVTSASAKFSDLNLKSEEGQKLLQKLKTTAREVGATTKFSATEAAGGLDFLAQAGFTAVQSIALLPGVANLAVVANLDLARTTDIASDVLGAFGLMTEDTAQLTKNFIRTQNVLAETMSSTNTDVETLFEAMKFGGPVFTSAGQSIESFSALAGRMAANAIKGSNAGTALRAGMIRLLDPPAKAAAALNKLGINVIGSGGKMKDMVVIVQELEKSMSKMEPTQRSVAIAQIFGKNAASAWAAVINEGTDKTAKLHEQLLNAKTSAADMAKIMGGSLQAKIAGLKSASIELGFKFVEAFAAQGSGSIDTFTEAIRAFDPTPIIAGLEFIVGALKIFFKVGSFVMNQLKIFTFTLADALLFTVGNAIRLLLVSFSKLSAVVGIKTPGIDSAIKKIEAVQNAVRKRSIFQGGGDAPNKEEARSQSVKVSGQITVKGPRGTEVKDTGSGAPAVRLDTLGQQ